MFSLDRKKSAEADYFYVVFGGNGRPGRLGQGLGVERVQARAFEDDPIEAGLFDLSRYHPTALP